MDWSVQTEFYSDFRKAVSTAKWSEERWVEDPSTPACADPFPDFTRWYACSGGHGELRAAHSLSRMHVLYDERSILLSRSLRDLPQRWSLCSTYGKRFRSMCANGCVATSCSFDFNDGFTRCQRVLKSSRHSNAIFDRHRRYAYVFLMSRQEASSACELFLLLFYRLGQWSTKNTKDNDSFSFQFSSLLTENQLITLSHRLRQIKYIHDVLRRPKAFNAVSRWKASEIRVFVLYVGLPLLIDILPQEEAGDLAVFTVIMRSMRDQWTGDRLQAQAITLLIKQYIEHLQKKQRDDLLPSSMLTITTHTHTHMPDQCLRFGRMEWQENFLFESCLGYLKQFVKGPDGAASQIATGFSCSFALQSLHQQQPISRGHFLIDEVNKIYGSNVFNDQSIIELVSPILDSSLRLSNDLGNAHRPVYFARLHKMFTTFHSFVYQRRGDRTCSYLVAYRQGSCLSYGYVMMYVLVDSRCLVSESSPT